MTGTATFPSFFVRERNVKLVYLVGQRKRREGAGEGGRGVHVANGVVRPLEACAVRLLSTQEERPSLVWIWPCPQKDSREIPGEESGPVDNTFGNPIWCSMHG